MTSTARQTNKKAVTGEPKQNKSTAGSPKKSGPNRHLIVPDLNLGADDDDDEGDEDDFQLPSFIPAAKTAAKPEATLPQQAEKEALPTQVAKAEAAGEVSAAPAVVSAETEAPAQQSETPEEATTASEGATAPAAHTAAVTPHQPVSDALRQEQHTEREPAETTVSAVPLPKHPDVLVTEPVQPPAAPAPGGFHVQSSDTQLGETSVPGSALAATRFAGSAHGGHSAATEVYGASTGAGLQVRRPGRRRVREPFNPEVQPSGPNQAMLDMVEQAPGYAALLTVYSAAQTKMESFGDRNIHLYGLTADEAGLQVVADKALLKTITKHEPKLTLAYYVDAALKPALDPFNPSGTDRQEMEDERDYVWQLAQEALKYRRYVLSDPQTATLPKYRAKSLLRTHVNERFTRMLNLMDSLAGINAKPFEIVSAIVAGYLDKLPTEQDGLKRVFAKHVMTSIH
ncbi:hypothetical protein [Streptomyces sp. NPDC029704]|uniref:hypothetical protein n=1 Tax=Streptomyces sp. NPDC029704 TaxID=3156920 RepID=UPI0033EBBE89